MIKADNIRIASTRQSGTVGVHNQSLIVEFAITVAGMLAFDGK